MNFNDIPMIHDPEFVNPKDSCHSVQLDGFVYVSNQMDIFNNKVITKDNPWPIINDKISQELLFEDFDLNF